MVDIPIKYFERSEFSFEFTGGPSVRSYLKPGEIGTAPLKFEVLTEDVNPAWSVFLAKFKTLLGDIGRPNALGTHSQYRLVICGTVEPALKHYSQGPPVVTLPVKVKLVPNLPRETSRAQRERSCLIRLARVFEPQNLEVVLEGVELYDDKNNRSEWPKLRLSWNEKELCWEADEQVNIKTEEATFGKEGYYFDISRGSVNLSFTNCGVSWMLLQIYGKRGSNWRMQQEMLEGGKYADMEILSTNPVNRSEQTPIKCHRFLLSGASAVFDRMLEEGGENPGEVKWKEAESRTVTLPESEDAIKALLHFLYYGGCEQIFRNRVDIVLELLEAGEKYGIPSLVEVASFVLLTDAKEDDWFTADAAMQLFNYARHLEGKTWNDLKSRSYLILKRLGKSQRMASAEYQELLQIMIKLGPTFSNTLEPDFQPNRPFALSQFGQNVTKAEAVVAYDFLSAGNDFTYPVNLDVGLGMAVLAEICGKLVPRFEAGQLHSRFLKDDNLYDYEVDYLIELFCYSKQKKGGCWLNLKKGAMRLLQTLLVEDRRRVQLSKKYWEMLHKNPDAFDEFTWLCNMEFADEIKKRKRAVMESGSDTE